MTVIRLVRGWGWSPSNLFFLLPLQKIFVQKLFPFPDTEELPVFLLCFSPPYFNP